MKFQKVIVNSKIFFKTNSPKYNNKCRNSVAFHLLKYFSDRERLWNPEDRIYFKDSNLLEISSMLSE